MKKFIGLMVLLGVLLYPTIGTARTIKLGASEWPPFMLEQKEGQGLFVEITQKALEAVGHKLEVKFFPWARAVNNVKSGEIDALTSVSYTEERAVDLVYPELPIFETSMMMYHSSNSANLKPFSSLEDMCAQGKTFRIGVMNEQYIIPRLQKYKCLDLQIHSDVPSMPKKTANGRLDYFIDSNRSLMDMKSDPAKFGLTPQEINSITTGAVPLDVDKIYTVFSKKAADSLQLSADFVKGLKIIKSNGVYEEIFKKYGVTFVK